ncbi:mannitol dehydrogenase family protein [Cellvibrio sp. KY-GH-1]|uniref:mannitol dehydrogenase family protein n=1 Tax=Cellvibrio sp. KY-GH-1 TaxID=2303332 RepID=UPI001245E608|nr:mannitol dehydrogenase family protein [Cellvibrio sp. KY-GH-1]QEY17769.1 mannitol dehydrogenase family protein [Cellvibrio sp. KY-GH-1]
MNRLNKNLLSQLPKDVALPTYEREKLVAGIVHLGIGAFHRAHQAFYTEAVLNQFGGDWGIIGSSLRSASVRDQLVPQDCLYTLVERSGEGEKLQIIGAVTDTLVGPENPAALVATIAQPTIKIVSLTVTEKGYCHDPATGNLNEAHPDIIHDLQHLEAPVSAIGFIVAALKQRFDKNQKAFTALSCDNLPNNGEVLEKVVLQFAQKISPALADWIKANATFPSTMIDRIVPATTDDDRRDIENRLGARDEGMVVCEPFSQWVVEDKFADGRPEWEKVGVLLVKDVRVFEKIKLRLLNGAHSTMAYTGYLSGFQYISEVMEQPAFVKLVTTYMAREAGETVAAPAGFDIEAYKQQLRDRFSNKALKHRTWQIAMDGSQKLPQRLLETLREQLKGNGNIDILCLGVAAWIRYVSGVDEQGQAIEVSDPLAKELRAACDANQGNPAGMVKAVASIQKVFGTDLIDEPRFIQTTTQWLERFYSKGVLASIQESFQ